ncbi:MAG: hypothetical protein WCG29_05100 [Desulfomonile sp.]|jgi:hypothetical protein|nr:hypothetical protein [Deltaproteobacteria bacterium]
MKQEFLAAFRRHEIYVVATVIALVFVAAMGIVAWLLQSSVLTPPYESLSDLDLKQVFATAYLRFREDDGTPYLKVELHNGTLWWIKKLEFDFEGISYALRESDTFRPLHFGAARCNLKKPPLSRNRVEYDLRILKAYGYAPAQVQWDRGPEKIAGGNVAGTRQN